MKAEIVVALSPNRVLVADLVATLDNSKSSNVPPVSPTFLTGTIGRQ
jgi:hypothetical protein